MITVDPDAQYQQKKYNDDPMILQCTSTKVCEVTRAVQLYMRLGDLVARAHIEE